MPSKREKYNKRDNDWGKDSSNLGTTGTTLAEAASSFYGFSADDIVESENADLVMYDDGSFEYREFLLTPVGFEIQDDINQESFDLLGQFLFTVEGSLQWLLGDWLVHSDRYGYGDIGAIAERFNREPQTLYKYKSVCNAVKIFLRRKVLSFTHHEAVQGMSDDEMGYWLDRAVEEGWSARALSKAIKDSRLKMTGKSKTSVDLFTKDYMSFAKKQLGLAKKSNPKDRMQMADMLRALADSIENM